MRELRQLATVLAFTLNLGLFLGLYLSDGEQSPHLTAIALATALVSLIALSLPKAGN